MAQITGSFGRVVIDKEQSYKTPKATPAGWVIPFTTCGLASDQNLLESNTITSDRNPQEPGLGQVNVSGDLAVELGGLAHTRLIYLALGDYSVTAQDPDATPGSGDEYYEHTIKVGSSIPSFITEIRFSDGAGLTRYAKFDGCKIATWSFSLRTDAFAESTFSITGSSETFTSTEYDSSPDDVGFGPFTTYNATLKIGGSSAASITEISFNVNNNLDENTFAIGTGSVRTQLPEGRVGIDGNFTAQFTDDTLTYIDMAQNSQETSLVIELARGNGSGTTGNEYLKIEFPEIKLRPPRKEITGPQGVFLTFNFFAYADDSDSAIIVTAKNQIQDLSI